MSEWKPMQSAPKDRAIIALLGGDQLDVAKVTWYDEDEDGSSGWYDDYGGDYKPLGWIDIPEMPVEKHKCMGNGLECISEDDSGLFLHVYDGFSGKLATNRKVMFCPLCGYSPKDRFSQCEPFKDC
jgi:hypothetical protein